MTVRQQFNPQNFHEAVDNGSQIGISYLAALQQVLIENLGGLSLYSIDALFGGLALALATRQYVGTGVDGFTFSILFIVTTVFGIATTAVQYRLWRIILRTNNWKERWPYIIVGAIVAIFDTGIDGTLVEWFLGGSPEQWPRPFEQTSFLYWAVWILVVVVCGLNEPLIELFKNQGYRSVMRSTLQQRPWPVRQRTTSNQPRRSRNNGDQTRIYPHSSNR
jgi:hypothetical protein